MLRKQNKTYRVDTPLSRYARTILFRISRAYDTAHVFKSRVPANATVLVRCSVHVWVVSVICKRLLLIVIWLLRKVSNVRCDERPRQDFPHDKSV